MMECKIKLNNKHILVKDTKGRCAYNYLRGDKFSLRDIIPEGLCLHAFHTFLPYYLTLKNDGWFDWVKPNDGVCVHCPYPEGIIVKIYKRTKEFITVQIVNNPENCLYSYSSGKEFNLGNFKFCPRALDVIYPLLLKHNVDFCEINCPSYNNNVAFQIVDTKLAI